MRERIIRGKRGEGESGRDGLLQSPGIAQGSHQSVMGLKTVRISMDGGLKALHSFSCIACSELIQALL